MKETAIFFIFFTILTIKATATPVDSNCYEESTRTVNIQCDESSTEMSKCGSFLGEKKKDVKILQINNCEALDLAEFINSFGHLDRLVISSMVRNFTQLDELCCSVGLRLVKQNSSSVKSIPSGPVSVTCEPETEYRHRVGNRIIKIAKSDKIFGVPLWLFVILSFAITIAITLKILFRWK